jgi:D-alanine-D-alanine ligase
MTHILVLSGGISSEREVSLRSAAAVAEALKDGGYQVTMYDTQQGINRLPASDVVFPVLHGMGGEDGTIQSALDTAGTLYIGSDAAASALCFDKWAYKQKLRKAGLPVTNGALVTAETLWQSPFLAKPFVLKPFDGGSSIDTFIVRDVQAIPEEQIKACFVRHEQMLIEELVEGLEITVGVLENTALPAVEIIPPAEGEFDYENKYNGKTQELCPPQHISNEVHQRAQGLALQIHKLTGCRDLSRTDMMVTDDNEIYVIETNTMPGMTEQSLYPKAAAAAGIPMAELVSRFVKAAQARA